MKLSVAWIFDHIDADWNTVSIVQLIDSFNQTVAEIEGYQKIAIDNVLFTSALVVAIYTEHVIVQSSEWSMEIALPIRDDVRVGYFYMITKISDHAYRWSLLEDFSTNRSGYIPAIRVADSAQHTWKSRATYEDYIIDVDNKSINHRPDLWSHRGIAREIAALFGLKLKPLSSYLADKETILYAQTAHAEEKNAPSITIQTALCTRFAGLYIDQIHNEPSLWWMALRLLSVGGRPLNLIIDATNYVMFDIGQPLHAFDAERIAEKKIIVRTAHTSEHLLLLNDEEIALTPEDIVIADGEKALSLAGIRGGKESGIHDDTHRLFIESAHFDAATIRHTSMRVKLRTESSARFEKHLDPYQAEIGIMRFIKLLDDEHIAYKSASKISVIGTTQSIKIITVSHHFIESRLGTSLGQQFILDVLRKLEFIVSCENNEYHITIPSFRATKDITIPEDIVEEIGRYLGYTNMQYQLPERTMAPFDMLEVQRRRMIKQFFAYAGSMQEVANYAFYDERFLYHMQWQPRESVFVANPQSENWKQLVTSLIPHLIKNVVDNKEQDAVRFFEWARRWRLINQQPKEQQIVAGIISDRKKTVDFYESKDILLQFIRMLGISCQWMDQTAVKTRKIAGSDMFIHEPWDHDLQTAYIVHNNIIIGKAGKMASSLLHAFNLGDAFIFELDADYLRTIGLIRHLYKAQPKYPSIHRDISIMVPSSATVYDIEQCILAVDKRIEQVRLVDQFEKKEWIQQKSLTFTMTIADYHATLTSQDADILLEAVMQALSSLGAAVR